MPRSAVTPGAPTNGNSDFASEAPLWIETMAIKMTSIGSHAGILRTSRASFLLSGFVKCGKGSSVNELPATVYLLLKKRVREAYNGARREDKLTC